MNDEIIDIAEDTISESDAEFLENLGDDATEEISGDEADLSAEYERRIAELEDRLKEEEARRQRREKEIECISILGDAGLPAELMGTVILADDMVSVVEIIRRTIQSRVDAEVSKRCRTDAPLVGSKAPLTKEELIRMPVAELQRMRDSGFMMNHG